MNKNILITGCCGFIGSNMCEFLLKKKYKIIGIDNLITGRIENINDFINSPNFIFIEQDICENFELNHSINKIIHFASPASPKDYLKFPIETLRSGSVGTEKILDLALKYNATVLVASTSEVYGDPLEHPQSEEYFGNVNPVGPRSVYDEAKRYLEAITSAYHSKYKLNTKIARIFNTYGPKMKRDDGRAIPNFICQALNNEEITVYGNGHQTRSFCYIDDTIVGLYKLLYSSYQKPVNIGNPFEISIIDLVDIIKRLTNTKSKISYKKLPQNDPKIRKPNIKLATNLLEWNPNIKLEDGLIKTINYFSDK